MVERSIYIGFDSREEDAFTVTRHSMLRRMTRPIPVHSLVLEQLECYKRPTTREGNRLYDMLSVRPDYNGAMSTEHAISRFFVPMLARKGWVLFMDCDMLVRDDIGKVFEDLDSAKAVYCVQHAHVPLRNTKMDGQQQTIYARKNWSSFMIFNCEHRSNRALDLNLLNKAPGRNLHAFCWLGSSEIGALDPKWNHLVGWSPPPGRGSLTVPAVVHFTSGTPDMPGYERCTFADEWRAELALANLERAQSAFESRAFAAEQALAAAELRLQEAG